MDQSTHPAGGVFRFLACSVRDVEKVVSQARPLRHLPEISVDYQPLAGQIVKLL